MNQILSSEEIVKLTRQVAALYIQEYPRLSFLQTFGEWVMGKFYADNEELSLVNAREFAGAERTVDGRMYLSGMLRTGSLSPEPLLRAVESTEISDVALSFVS